MEEKQGGVRDRSWTSLNKPCSVDSTLDHVNVSQSYKIRLSSKKTHPKKGK